MEVRNIEQFLKDNGYTYGFSDEEQGAASPAALSLSLEELEQLGADDHYA